MTYRDPQTGDVILKWPTGAGDVHPEDSHIKDSIAGSYLATLAATLTGDHTYTLSDNDMTLAALNLAQTWTANQTLSFDSNGGIGWTVTNTNAGNAGRGFYNLSNGTYTLGFGVMGPGNTTLPTYAAANEAYFRANTNLILTAANVGNVFKFNAGGAANGPAMPTVQISRTDTAISGYDAVTNAVTEIASIDHESSGTPAAGFGAQLSAYLESSTTARQLAGALRWVWTTATHATRAAKAVISVVLAGTETERVVVGDAVQIGDIAGGNYTEIESDGTIEFVGNAMVWDDLRIEPTARTTGANAPTFEKWYDDAAGTSRGVYLYSFDDAAGGSEKEIFFTIQLPHSWALTDIDLHVHWVGAVDDTTAAPRWGLEYTWMSLGGTYGDTTTIYATTKTPTDANVTAGKHYLTAFGALSPSTTANTISSILIGRLFRDSANAADTYNATGAKCGLLSIDAHYEINTIGSRTELDK